MVTDAEVGLYWHTVLHSSVLQTSDFFFFLKEGETLKINLHRAIIICSFSFGSSFPSK